jgi:hypothetical protein
MRKPADLDDYRVDEAWKTGMRNPETYDGRLHDGRWFYYRYRWGYASVGVGPTYEEAVEDEAHGSYQGGVFDGQWPDDNTRNMVFRELLDKALDRQNR